MKFFVIPQSQVRLDRGSLPSETLRRESLETGQSRDVAEGTVLRASTPWFIAQRGRCLERSLGAFSIQPLFLNVDLYLRGKEIPD